MEARQIFERLNGILFNSNDKNNPHTLAENKQIDEFVNQAITEKKQKIAYYIGPTIFSFNSNISIQDIAKHICKRNNPVSKPLNDFYSEKELDKPFIVIANTDTVLAKRSTDVNVTGGVHWIGWVLLPKKYQTLQGKIKETDKYQLFFFDSLGERLFPEKLKDLLLNGGEVKEDKNTIKLFPFCKKNEIEFIDCNPLAGQQKNMNASDCGWWSVYYVLMTVYTGDVIFLGKWKNQSLSAIPLRKIMNLTAQARCLQLNEIRKNPPTITKFSIGALSAAEILFLRSNNTLFNSDGFKLLKQVYETHKKDDNFTALFLQMLDESAAKLSKQFLIQKKEWILLVKLFNKFPQLKLTSQDIEDIYLNENIYWLERSGTYICYGLRTLNTKLEEIFQAVLNEDSIDGRHTVYACNIFNKLILPFLDLIHRKEATSAIDRMTFVRMITFFLNFATKQGVFYQINNIQLETLLKLIEKLLNQSKTSQRLLSVSVSCLVKILIAAELKIINLGKTLLVLNSVNEFECELKLNYKEPILELLKCKLTKSEGEFEASCKKIFSQLTLRAEGVIRYSILSVSNGTKEYQKQDNDSQPAVIRSFEAPF